MVEAARYLSLIKFSHSIFALPFALLAFLVATNGALSPRILALVVVAMVAARSAAMAYNRFVDRELDAANPRTASREIPVGLISPAGALVFTALSSLVFVSITWFLGSVCFWLSFPVLAILLGYSHAKRYTSLSHLWLGLALGLAPPAAWLAARLGVLEADIFQPLLLGFGVSLWVAGFDILYACQDQAFDRSHGLHSLPVRLGLPAAMRCARMLHLAAVALFFVFGIAAGLGLIYQAGVGLTALILLYQHRLLSPGELSRINAAFFTRNACVSLMLLGFGLSDLYIGR